MYRTTAYFSLIVATFALLGLVVPHYITPFALPNGPFAAMYLLLALVLMHFSVAAYFRRRDYKFGFGFVGAILLFLTLTGIFSPTYMGILPDYMRPINLLLMLLLGLGYMIAGLEFDRPSLQQELWSEYQKQLLRVELKRHQHVTTKRGSKRLSNAH